MSKVVLHTAPPEIQIPQHVLDDLANQKPHGKLYYRWQQAKELWHALFDKYFISRDLIKPCEPIIESPEPSIGPQPSIGTIEKTDYFNVTDGKFYKSPKNATVVGFFMGAVFVITLRKKSKDTNYQFSLVPVPELAFIRHVTGEDQEGITKKDFR